MRVKTLLFFILLATSNNVVSASNDFPKVDSLLFETYIKQVSPIQNESIDRIITKTALFFLGTPYVASTLDKGEQEQLVVDLSKLDCTTFVENCIALSGVIKSGNHSYPNYKAMLTLIRYRNNTIDGYTSRLHYMSDWVYENQKNKVLNNITLDMGGKTTKKLINFMSTHPQSYKQLKNSTINQTKIQDIEFAINQRDNYSFIPKKMISSIEEEIQDGDIILFATTIPGLDYSHVGIAYRDRRGLRFIHASSAAKKVIVENKSLIDYCSNSRTCSGITVLRVNNK